MSETRSRDALSAAHPPSRCTLPCVSGTGAWIRQSVEGPSTALSKWCRHKDDAVDGGVDRDHFKLPFFASEARLSDNFIFFLRHHVMQGP